MAVGKDAAAETPTKLFSVPALVVDVPGKTVRLRLAKPPSCLFLSPNNSKGEFSGTCVTVVALETENLEQGSAEKDGAETGLKRLLVVTALVAAMLLPLLVLAVGAMLLREL